MNLTFWHRASGTALALLLVACQPHQEAATLADAKALLQRHDVAVAEIALKNYLQTHPEEAEARYLMGTLLFRAGRYKLAEIELRKALSGGHAADAVVPLLARSLLRQGRAAALLSEFEDTQLSTPDGRASLLSVQAAALVLQGKPEQAGALTDQALALRPDHPQATALKARRDAGAGRADAAIALLRDNLQRHPNEVDSWVLLAELQASRAADRAGAEASYQKALSVDPLSIQAHAGLLSLQMQRQAWDEAERAFKQLKKYQPRHPQTIAMGIHFDAHAGRWDAARKTAAELLKQTPSEPRLLFVAAAIELQTGAPRQAEVYAQKGLKAAPDIVQGRLLLARAQLDIHQPEQALGTLRPLLADTKAPNAEALGLAGRAELTLGRAQQALVYLDKARALEPDSAQRKTAQAVARIAAGSTDDGLAELVNLSNQAEASTADLVLIAEQQKLGQWEQALASARRLEKKLPGKALPLQLQARIELAREKPAEARKALGRALSEEPGSLSARTELAELDAAERRFKEAEQQFRAVLRESPGQPRAIVGLANVLQLTGRSGPEVRQLVEDAVRLNPLEPALRLRLIEGLRASGDLKGALAVAQQAHAALPDSTELLDALGQAQQDAGERKQAAGTYQRLALLLPQSAAPLVRIADLQAQDGAPERALETLRRAIAVEPDRVASYRVVMALALRLQKPDAAMAFAKALQKRLPERHEGFALEGDVHVHLQAWPEALASYRRSLGLEGGDAAAWQMHRALRLAKRDADAERFADDWLKAHANDARFAFYLGDVATQAGDWPAAERNYRAVVQMQPGNGWAHNNLAWALNQQGKAEARAVIDAGLRLLPDAASLHHTGSWVYARLGDESAARAAAERAVQLAPGNPQFLLRAAELSLAQGQKNAARAWLDRAAAHAAADPKLSAEIERLRKRL